jgi:uncharacterized protein YeaO (DUF488 family)
MSVHHYRYGEPPARPGLRIGVTRHLPRGVPKAEYATRGYFDVWLPLLAPSRELVSAYRDDRVTRAQFARRYRAELANPAARQAIPACWLRWPSTSRCIWAASAQTRGIVTAPFCRI